MGRNFNGSTDYIEISSSTGLCDWNSAWSWLAFFRTEGQSGDQGSPISKWGGSAHRQMEIRTNTGAGNLTLLIMADAVQFDASGAGDVVLNTWYLVAITNDGLDTTGSVNWYLVGMDGTIIDSGSFNPDNDQTNDAACRFGRTANSADELNGDVAHSAYFTYELTQAEVLAYLFAPAMFVAMNRSSSQFYFPLGLSSPECDWSGNGRTGTVSGAVVGENPPIGSLYGRGIQEVNWAAAAAAGIVPFRRRVEKY